MILKASCRLRPDGPDVLNETVYELYGCKFHGCTTKDNTYIILQWKEKIH